MLHWIDLVILLLALAAVAVVSILASRGERTREDYFLAGRKLTWWLVGISLIASNISTEHFVGMTGKAASQGIAVAGYEWLSAIGLVIVTWWLLPVFLRAGVYPDLPPKSWSIFCAKNSLKGPRQDRQTTHGREATFRRTVRPQVQCGRGGHDQ